MLLPLLKLRNKQCAWGVLPADKAKICGCRLCAVAKAELIIGVAVFGWFRKREKPRVFLGTLVVVPRAGWKPQFDLQWGMHEQEDFDASLRAALQEIFSLPPASEVHDPLPTDLGLDVFVPSFQSGGFWSFSLGGLEIPIFWLMFWRPKVTVTGRLSYLRSQKTYATYSVTRKMPWREFLNRQFTLRAFFRFRPAFGAEDLTHLLYLACHSLLSKLTKVI